jgi:hypothetical protein
MFALTLDDFERRAPGRPHIGTPLLTSQQLSQRSG